MQRFLNEIVYIDKKYRIIKADNTKPSFCNQCAFNVPAFCIKLNEFNFLSYSCHPRLVYEVLT